MIIFGTPFFARMFVPKRVVSVFRCMRRTDNRCFLRVTSASLSLTPKMVDLGEGWYYRHCQTLLKTTPTLGEVLTRSAAQEPVFHCGPLWIDSWMTSASSKQLLVSMGGAAIQGYIHVPHLVASSGLINWTTRMHHAIAGSDVDRFSVFGDQGCAPCLEPMWPLFDRERRRSLSNPTF